MMSPTSLDKHIHRKYHPHMIQKNISSILIAIMMTTLWVWVLWEATNPPT